MKQAADIGPLNGNGVREITDLVVSGAVGEYGLEFTRYWNSCGEPGLHGTWSAGYRDNGLADGGWNFSWNWQVELIYGNATETCDPENNPQCLGDTYQAGYAINIRYPDGQVSSFTHTQYGTYEEVETPSFRSSYSHLFTGDHLRRCNSSATDFELHLRDGGVVHFVNGQAIEVFDKHGLRTQIEHNAAGQVTKVIEPAGRELRIIWQDLPNSGPHISAVESGSGTSLQRVEYGYSWQEAVPNGSATFGDYALTQVKYMNEPLGGGQYVTATYIYTPHISREGTTGAVRGCGCLLSYADDPHFEGAMTKVRYVFRGGPGGTPFCPLGSLNPQPLGDAVPFLNMQAFPVEQELSGETTELVSQLYIPCNGMADTGTRLETRGAGGVRKFYYGQSGLEPGAVYHGNATYTPPEANPYVYGYGGLEPIKLTDFAVDANAAATAPTDFWHYFQAQPWRVFDHNDTLVEYKYTPGYNNPAQYDSCSQITEAWHRGSDNSKRFYNWTNPGSSDAIDTAKLRNLYYHYLFSKTDERNNTTTYTRDSLRRVKAIGHPDSSSEAFTYNSFNQTLTHTLPSSATDNFEYDARGLLLREWNTVDGYDARKEYTYDAFDRVLTMTDGRARAAGAPFTVQMDYNGRHQMTKVTYPGTIPAQPPTPDGDGGLSTAQSTSLGGSPQSPTTSATPLPTPRPTPTVPPLPTIPPLTTPTPPSTPTPPPLPTPGPPSFVTYEYDAYGNCTAITNELGHRSTYVYDTYRRCTSYTEPLDAPAWNGTGTVASRTWTWVYDRVVGGNTVDASTHTSKNWRLQLEPIYDSASHRRFTERTYDFNERLTTEKRGYENSPGVYTVEETNSYTYDANGNKASYTDPLSRLTTYGYDLRDRLTSTTEPLSRITTTAFDTTGNKTLVTFPDTRTQQWLDYDGFGQPGRFIDERNNTTNLTYQWGPMKKLASVTTHRDKDSGGTEDQLTTFSYDDTGRVLRVTFPDSSYEQSTYQFWQLSTWRVRKGAIKTFSYDARGREISNSWDDSNTPGITKHWDLANRLTSLINSNSTVAYSYDKAGQVASESIDVAGAGGAALLSYYRYPDGSPATLIYPNGFKLRRDYTARRQLARVSSADAGGNPVTQFANYAYLADGKLDYENHANGVSTDLGYDGRGFINSVNTFKSGQLSSNRSYGRDTRDRITWWKNVATNRGDRYTYDNEGQLTAAVYQAENPDTTPTGAQRNESFIYDALGNRKGVNVVAGRGSVTFTRDNNGLNQYASWSPSAINHDDDIGGSWGAPGAANGVVMQEGWITAGYNALNQMFTVYSPSTPGGAFENFAYDPLGRCVKRAPGNGGASLFLYYDGWNLIQEGPAASVVDRTYVHGNRVDEVVASQVGGTTFYHHYDARGHCILVTNASGSVVEQYDYDAFGKPYFYDGAGASLPNGSSIGNRFLFTGREWLKELNLYDYRNRVYQPELGRFLQPDPKHFEAGDYNLYRYCHNDPVNKTDPTGLDADYLLDTNNIAAAGAGHAAALIGNEKTGYDLYSFGPGSSPRTNADNMSNAHFATRSDAMKALAPKYEKTLHYKTDEKADNAARAEASKHTAEDYKPTKNNCGHVASSIVGAAVPKFKQPPAIAPKTTYKRNRDTADYAGKLKQDEKKN